MKPRTATNIDQSKRLLACGVDTKTADIRIEETMVDFRLSVGKWYDGFERLNMTPAWSLSALLALIPQRILAPHADTPCDFILHHHPTEWIAMYHDGKFTGDPDDYIWQCCSESRAECPVEACVKMIEWLTENGYKLNIPTE